MFQANLKIQHNHKCLVNLIIRMMEITKMHQNQTYKLNKVIFETQQPVIHIPDSLKNSTFSTNLKEIHKCNYKT